MKSVILAGGLGSRISEETHLKPKPMIEIGGKPIIWHIMKRYSMYGIREFVICSGYMSHIIENYFKEKIEDWEVKVINTGKNTMTGGRLKRIEKNFDKMQIAILDEIGSIGKNIHSLKKEVGMIENSFEKVMKHKK